MAGRKAEQSIVLGQVSEHPDVRNPADFEALVRNGRPLLLVDAEIDGQRVVRGYLPPEDSSLKDEPRLTPSGEVELVTASGEIRGAQYCGNFSLSEAAVMRAIRNAILAEIGIRPLKNY